MEVAKAVVLWVTSFLLLASIPVITALPYAVYRIVNPRSRSREDTAHRQDAALFLSYWHLARTPAYSCCRLDGNQ